jgi:queuine tRNA-ribosyltransferase
MFKIQKKIRNALGRAGVLTTSHGEIQTPAFATVATKATVKALSPEQAKEALGQVILANTYHLYLQPGEKIIQKAGGLHKFSNWPGPFITDSGGFQVFSLGQAFEKKISKIAKTPIDEETLPESNTNRKNLVSIDEEGVTFKNPADGKIHRFTPERSVEIQQALGADIIFTFDECTSPLASLEYQKQAMERTHRWAKISFNYHRNPKRGKLFRFTKKLLKIADEEYPRQYLFGIVQGGRFENLRKESARFISKIDFDGFGIGGSFEKEDIDKALRWVNLILPEEKPRHLLGIGEPKDLILAVENGADLFDCVNPTRLGRNGTLYTQRGKINSTKSSYKNDFSKIDEGCRCYCCQNFSKAYLHHLFKAGEMFGATLASIHNLYFINNLMNKIRESILAGKFFDFKEEFLKKYRS